VHLGVTLIQLPKHHTTEHSNYQLCPSTHKMEQLFL